MSKLHTLFAVGTLLLVSSANAGTQPMALSAAALDTVDFVQSVSPSGAQDLIAGHNCRRGGGYYNSYYPTRRYGANWGYGVNVYRTNYYPVYVPSYPVYRTNFYGGWGCY